MNLKKFATALRMLSADMIEKAKSGHPGASLGMADIATVLWAKFLKFDPQNPDWMNRDRVIFSNGHASPLLYSLFYLCGMKKMTKAALKNLRQWGSLTPGHPERGQTPGVDFSTGPLGQGLSGAVGMALAERILHQKFPDLIQHKTYCFVGDGCLMEGISEEVISLAGLWQLKNLIVLWDDNLITIDGQTNLTTKTNMRLRFEANGWEVLECNGHDLQEIEAALKQAQKSGRPVFIDCHTIIGYPAPTKSGKSCVHGSPLGSSELAQLKDNLKWTYPAFEVPDDVLEMGQKIGKKYQADFQQWSKKITPEFQDFFHQKFSFSLGALKQEFLKNSESLATRQASQKILAALLKQIPNLIGGSADLGASNLTKTEASKEIMPPDYTGNYINYGVRELGMAGIANGLAAYGGFLPYTSTFFSFSDYMKPAMRLGAIMNLKQIYVFTHDSIGSGEDGPTHQPIEQLISLRATPNLRIFRPADAIECVESYEVALKLSGPSALVLTRQKVKSVRSTADQNLTQKGAYVLKEVKDRKLTLIATGSEVSLALQVAAQLPHTAVVSMPCWELFEAQPSSYQEAVLGKVPRVVIEAASPFGWEKYAGPEGLILGLNHFGASAPGEVLFQHLGFTVENILTQIKEKFNI